MIGQLYLIKGEEVLASLGQSDVVRLCCSTKKGSTVLVEDPDGFNLREVALKSLAPISKSEAKGKGHLKTRDQLDRDWESSRHRRKW
jgi:hypothetical protein